MSSQIKVFNNEIEIGLRILVIVEYIYPKSFDIEMINYYDYFILHTKDVGGDESLHADVPNRFGELVVKRDLIRSSLKLLMTKGLVEIQYTDNGIKYKATENTAPFLDTLNEEYTMHLQNNIKWVYNKFKDYTYDDIKIYVDKHKEKWGSELSYCTIGLINE
ncbi:MAG: ABC-three component system middle component 2 [Poseidonibacter sp.]|uniref:ABC-three component system middle component 2 n=1 Tax=Poseidonibacter sp. TaxID=2321188 RepID=UPI00359E91A8